MSFLSDFAGGFAAVKMKQYEQQDKAAYEEDAYRKKRVIDLDISKQEADYKAQKEAERLKEQMRYINGETDDKTAEQIGTIFTPGSAQPTPTNPFNMAPESGNPNADFEEAQSWREKQARALEVGAEDVAKAANVKADIAEGRMKFSDKEREKARQDILSKDGVPILKQDVEAKTKKYKETLVRSDYGRGAMLQDADEFKIKLQEEQKDDMLNDALKSILADSLTNEVTGKLTVDAGTFDRFSKESIRLSNELSMATSAEEKEQITLELLELKSDMNAQQTGLGDTIFEALASQGKVIPELSTTLSTSEPEAKPVELSTDTAPAYKEGQTATNPSTNQKMIFKGGQWQPM
jgi:hypothetical protein